MNLASFDEIVCDRKFLFPTTFDFFEFGFPFWFLFCVIAKSTTKVFFGRLNSIFSVPINRAMLELLLGRGERTIWKKKNKTSSSEQKQRARGGGGWPCGAMVLPATLSRDAGSHSDLPQDGQEEAGPPRPRRPTAFYSSVFAQVRSPLDEMRHRACRPFPCFWVPAGGVIA
jgi:hypothetical protein